MNELAQDVSNIINNLLNPLGFKRNGKKDIYILPMPGDNKGWIGFNKATKGLPHSFKVNPVIGIRNDDVERMLSELTGIKSTKFVPATVAINIGYIMPMNDYLNWEYIKGLDNASQVENMIDTIVEHGLPFYENNKSLKDIVVLLESGFGLSEYNKYRLPIIYFLLGDIERAERVLNYNLDEYKDKGDMVAQFYKSFFNNFHLVLMNKK